MPLTIERKFPVILFFVFLMLTTVGIISYQTTQSLQDQNFAQRRTQEVVEKVDRTMTLAFEVQSAFSTFMMVSNNTYLDPIERDKPLIKQNIESLRQLTAKNQDQLDEVNRIDQTLKEFLSEVSRKVDRRKIEGPTVTAEELPWAEGKTMLDQMRYSAERIKAIQINAAAAYDFSTGRRFTVTVWVLIGASIAGIIALGIANLTVLSEIGKRKAAQGALIEVNEGLERNVEERTAELKKANEKLLEVGLERESILFSEKEARKEAEIANRLRDEFMATVSHELRTPLNSILGWARLMRGGTLDEAQSAKALTTIIKNSETQNRLIEDLMDVARVISGKLQLDVVELSPIELISQAIETVRPAADARFLHIDVDTSRADHNVLIDGDHNRLVQVFTNLLGNAIKFSHDGGAIHVSMETDRKNVIIAIRDEGKGITPEFLPMVFERFRQDVAKDSSNGGLGLGLAIVRNLVEMHHGSVRAESEGEERGSTFTVTLPAVNAPEPEEFILELEEHVHGGQQIIRDNVGAALKQ